MSRLLFAMLAGGIGFALYFTLGWKYWAILPAFGIYALVDWLGWIPGPYDTSVRNMLHRGEDAASRPGDRGDTA